MTFSDEILMAYADDELDPATRAAVEAAMAADPDIARQVARHRAMRGKLRTAYDEVLDEPVPDRLIAIARTAPAVRRQGNVIPLRRKSAPRWSWPQWGSIAASLVVGAIVGQLMLRSSAVGPITARNGQLLASGVLSHALSSQLASDQAPAAPVQIGVSFRSKSGDYCRTFVLRDKSALAGLACRDRDEWRLHVLAQNEPEGTHEGQYRPAGSAMPRAVVQAVDEQIAGEPLDAHAEATARSKDWGR
jgi:hypothetical protein